MAKQKDAYFLHAKRINLKKNYYTFNVTSNLVNLWLFWMLNDYLYFIGNKLEMKLS